MSRRRDVGDDGGAVLSSALSWGSNCSLFSGCPLYSLFGGTVLPFGGGWWLLPSDRGMRCFELLQ